MLRDISGNPETNSVYMYEVGSGNLLWDDIIEASRSSSAGYAAIEQDICPGDPFSSLKASYDYLITKGF